MVGGVATPKLGGSGPGDITGPRQEAGKKSPVARIQTPYQE